LFADHHAHRHASMAETVRGRRQTQPFHPIARPFPVDHLDPLIHLGCLSRSGWDEIE
jgi:hypothetical protein